MTPNHPTTTPEVVDHPLKLHAEIRDSRCNGPGHRHVLWVQGCTLGCPGCFNPEAQSITAGREESAFALADRIIREASERIEGVTITGGEPLQQPAGLLAFLFRIHTQSSLSVVLFSGYRIHEILGMENGSLVLDLVDVLVDGRYDPACRPGAGLRGSSNQQTHLLTTRYDHSHIEAMPEAEVIIASDGHRVTSGVQVPAGWSSSDCPGRFKESGIEEAPDKARGQ